MPTPGAWVQARSHLKLRRSRPKYGIDRLERGLGPAAKASRRLVCCHRIVAVLLQFQTGNCLPGVVLMPTVSRTTERPVTAALIRRIRGEYEEMPCLQLTLVQASRFLHVDRDTCRTILDGLVVEGFLVESRAGYRRAP